MTHTPGPWIVYTANGQHDEHPFILQDDGNRPSFVIAIVKGNVKGNAPLIAAAPDLLWALADLVFAHDQNPSMLTEEEWNAARKALKKARGK